MSLIAIKNLLLPFQSVGNLIAIILIVVLFCIFRLSLGGIDSVTDRAPNGSVKTAPNNLQPRTLAAQPVAPLDNPLKETLDRPAPKSPNQPQNPANQQKGLGDIEAQLGLR